MSDKRVYMPIRRWHFRDGASIREIARTKRPLSRTPFASICSKVVELRTQRETALALSPFEPKLRQWPPPSKDKEGAQKPSSMYRSVAWLYWSTPSAFCPTVKDQQFTRRKPRAFHPCFCLWRSLPIRLSEDFACIAGKQVNKLQIAQFAGPQPGLCASGYYQQKHEGLMPTLACLQIFGGIPKRHLRQHGRPLWDSVGVAKSAGSISGSLPWSAITSLMRSPVIQHRGERPGSRRTCRTSRQRL